jgi:hypothetical protein
MIFCFVTNFGKLRNVRIKKQHSVVNLSVLRELQEVLEKWFWGQSLILF